MYQELYAKAMVIIKDDTCTTFYKKEPIYLETDVLGVRLGVGHLQVRDGLQFPWDKARDNTTLCLIVFASKILTSAETIYNSIEREV